MSVMSTCVMVFHRGVGIFFITEGGATRSGGQFEASVRNDVRREKWKKHVVPVITTGCPRLDWVSQQFTPLRITPIVNPSPISSKTAAQV